MSQIAWLSSLNEFPCTSRALDEPNGLLAAGGDLSNERIISAYKKGIFPWYSEGQPILWWSPSPRMVLIPEHLHIGRTNRKLLKRCPFRVSFDRDFTGVIENCAYIGRRGQDGTWITQEMMEAYVRLFECGVAHSVECWQGDELVGGLYGLALGKVFFGESMFSKVSGGSKIAFVRLAQMLKAWDFRLIDCQQHTDYLSSFGAREIARHDFEYILSSSVNAKSAADWTKNWLDP